MNGLPGLSRDLQDILAEELNVKQIELTSEEADQVSVRMNLELTPELQREGMMREVVRNVQQARKAAGLQVDDRIILCLSTEAKELQQAIEEYATQIQGETLAASLVDEPQGQYTTSAKVEEQELEISLAKA